MTFPLETRTGGTRVVLAQDLLDRVPDLFRARWENRPVMVVADPTTYAVAGRAVVAAFLSARQSSLESFVYDTAALHAESERVAELEAALAQHDAIPVAVGAGTLNDLTKLAAHRTGRPYAVVATAASMDGYAAFGASITHEGSKQTFDCPAPELIVADLDVLCAAPPELSAAGYADLLAKLPAGADWLLADALGVEPLHPEAWKLAQGALTTALSDPEGVRRGELEPIRHLLEGLVASGQAMQLTRTSRPASGAEHQFSHLWDMQGHTHEGHAPPHGFKVGIGTLAIARLYEALFEQPVETLDVDSLSAHQPSPEETDAELVSLFPEPPLLAKAREETTAKRPERAELRAHLEQIRTMWPTLRERLRTQLPPSAELARRLAAVGAPVEPEELGISPARLRASYRQAYSIRRRYTVLDFAVRTGLLEPCLDRLFGAVA